MIITLTGPRSVGKTSVSKLVAKALKLKYVSSDEIGEKAFKKYGGLDKVIKTGKIKEIIKKGGYNLILREYKKDNFVFDLSGGSFSSRSMSKASKEIRKTAKNKSTIIGLLPSKNIIYSVFVLFNREKKRKHFKSENKIKLFFKTLRKYPYLKKVLNQHANFILYTKGKSPEEVAQEIVEKINQKPPLSLIFKNRKL